MSAYNIVIAHLPCPNCHAVVEVAVQFKFSNTRQFQYGIGDSLRWGGNDIGEQGKRRVVVDGVVEGRCPECDYDGDWNAYIHIENDRIERVESATGEFDFGKSGSNYIVIS